MFDYSHGIQTAFDALVAAFDEAVLDDDALHEFVDFEYAEVYNNSEDAIKAAFSLGTTHPTSNVYEIQWGESSVWFFGNERDIIESITKKMPKRK